MHKDAPTMTPSGALERLCHSQSRINELKYRKTTHSLNIQQSKKGKLP